MRTPPFSRDDASGVAPDLRSLGELVGTPDAAPARLRPLDRQRVVDEAARSVANLRGISGEAVRAADILLHEVASGGVKSLQDIPIGHVAAKVGVLGSGVEMKVKADLAIGAGSGSAARAARCQHACRRVNSAM